VRSNRPKDYGWRLHEQRASLSRHQNIAQSYIRWRQLDNEDGKAYEDLLEHTVEIEFRGHTIRVLDLKMLVELKRASTDPRDTQRLPMLEETLRQVEKE
jgi:hypothetical protein